MNWRCCCLSFFHDPPARMARRNLAERTIGILGGIARGLATPRVRQPAAMYHVDARRVLPALVVRGADVPALAPCACCAVTAPTGRDAVTWADMLRSLDWQCDISRLCTSDNGVSDASAHTCPNESQGANFKGAAAGCLLSRPTTPRAPCGPLWSSCTASAWRSETWPGI